MVLLSHGFQTAIFAYIWAIHLPFELSFVPDARKILIECLEIVKIINNLMKYFENKIQTFPHDFESEKSLSFCL